MVRQTLITVGILWALTIAVFVYVCFAFGFIQYLDTVPKISYATFPLEK